MAHAMLSGRLLLRNNLLGVTSYLFTTVPAISQGVQQLCKFYSQPFTVSTAAKVAPDSAGHGREQLFDAFVASVQCGAAVFVVCVLQVKR